jgi:hypothetical protein
MKITDLPVVTPSTITQNHVFCVGTTSSTEQLTLANLQKCFTGLTAPSSSSISIIGGTTPSGITVGANGYVGIDKTNPQVALDIGDIGSATVAEAKITSRTAGRQASYTLSDSAVSWRHTKKASDTDYYIECSTNGSNYTGFLNIDVNGNVGIFSGSANLTNKLYVSGGGVTFQSGASGILFDPGLCEIRNTVAGDILYLNKNTSDDVCIGDNVLYVENGANSYVGINTTSPAYNLDVKGSSVFVRFNNDSTSTTSLLLSNTTRNGYLTLFNNNLLLGGVPANSTANLVYDCANQRLGLGTNSPSAKIHTKSSDTISSIFESDVATKNETLIINSYASGPVNANICTFATGTVASPTKRWSIGLYSTGPYVDQFAFLLDGGTNTSAIRARLTRDGDLHINGTLSESSALRYKENIEPIENVLEDVCKLNPVSYNLINTSKKQFGVIAEEVDEIFPDLVCRDGNNEIQAVNYTRLTAVLIQAVKELQSEIEELKKTNNNG